VGFNFLLFILGVLFLGLLSVVTQKKKIHQKAEMKVDMHGATGV